MIRSTASIGYSPTIRNSIYGFTVTLQGVTVVPGPNSETKFEAISGELAIGAVIKEVDLDRVS